MLRPGLVTLALVSACATPAPRPTARSRAPVVVAIVVDQLAGWIADERLPRLPPTGGFARLRREGTWHHKMRFAHGSTDTGPGHAALYAGAPPRDSGVWGNERIDDEGVKRSIFRDEGTALIAPVDTTGRPGSSLKPLVMTTIADRLRAASAESVIISLSLKDRAALIGGGRRPSLTLWYDREIDSFATSSAVAAVFPLWAVPIGGREALLARRRQPWRPLDPAWLERNAGGVPDDGPGEGDLGGFGTRFPHDFAAAKDAPRAFRGTPLADQIVLELAAAAIERMARPDAPLLVALSLSANDYVGHLFGPGSREAWDELLQLDAALARFFATLDARYGADGWSVILTADHGVEHPTPNRLVHAELAARLEEVARELGTGPWIAGVADPYVFLTAKARALPPDKLKALIAIVRKELAEVPGVAASFDARETAAACPPESDESVPALLCRSLPPTSDPRIYVLVGDDGWFDSDLVVGSGANHGSPRDEDRTVPLLIRAPGRVAAGRSIEEPVSYKLFGTTLAALLGMN